MISGARSKISVSRSTVGTSGETSLSPGRRNTPQRSSSRLPAGTARSVIWTTDTVPSRWQAGRSIVAPRRRAGPSRKRAIPASCASRSGVGTSTSPTGRPTTSSDGKPNIAVAPSTPRAHEPVGVHDDDPGGGVGAHRRLAPDTDRRALVVTRPGHRTTPCSWHPVTMAVHSAAGKGHGTLAPDLHRDELVRGG